MPKLRAPDPRFNRKLEDYAAKTYSVEGSLLLRGVYEDHLKNALPGPADAKVLDAIFKDKNWMAAGTA